MFQSSTSKKLTMQISPLEKYTLRQKPLEKIIIKNPLNFYFHTPVSIKNGIAHYFLMLN